MLTNLVNLVVRSYQELSDVLFHLVERSILEPLASVNLLLLPFHFSPLFLGLIAYGYFDFYFFKRKVIAEQTQSKPKSAILTLTFKAYCSGVFLITALAANEIFYQGPFSPINFSVIFSIFIYSILLSFFNFLFNPEQPEKRIIKVNDQGAKTSITWFKIRNSILTVGLFIYLLESQLSNQSANIDRIYAISITLYLVSVLMAIYFSRHILAMLFSAGGEKKTLFGHLKNYWQVLFPSFVVFVYTTFLNTLINHPESNLSFKFLPVVTITSMLVAVDRTLIVISTDFFKNASHFEQKDQWRGDLVVDIFRIIFLVYTAKISYISWGGDLSYLHIASIDRDFIDLILSIIGLYATAYIVVYRLSSYLMGKFGLTKVDLTEINEARKSSNNGEYKKTLNEIEQLDGVGASRAETTVPLLLSITRFAIYILFTLVFLVINNIDIGPVIASVGILGIAIGFGAQKLVQDVISGFFFLLDDAFRLKEFIEIEKNLKGSVEKISLRSIQLRHHLGCVQTVPYSEIKTIKNHSRDWVVMRMDFRLALNTDVERTRNIIQELGDQVIVMPEYEKKLISPLRALGVVMMDENAIIFRAKFTSVPGEQWELRRELYRMIMDLFEKNKIRIAPKEITLSINNPVGTIPHTDKLLDSIRKTLERIKQ